MASSHTGSGNLISSSDVISQTGSGSSVARSFGSGGALSLDSTSNVVLIAINDSDQAEAAVNCKFM